MSLSSQNEEMELFGLFFPEVPSKSPISSPWKYYSASLSTENLSYESVVLVCAKTTVLLPWEVVDLFYQLNSKSS